MTYKLTDAQVRALKNPQRCKTADFMELMREENALDWVCRERTGGTHKWAITDAGRAILAAIEVPS